MVAGCFGGREPPLPTFFCVAFAALWFHQLPSLAIPAVFAFGIATPIQPQGFDMHYGLHPNNEPGTFRDDVCHQEVDLGGGIRNHAAADSALRVDVVSTIAECADRLHLYPPEALA